MADRTGIEWTDATWNPVVGCSLVSPGCTNCYAMGQAARIVRCSEGLRRASTYDGTVETVKGRPVWTGRVALASEVTLTQPLRWKRPRRIFVNSMGDLFHEDVPDEWIDQVFAVMALSPQHSFQILTKRSARMREYLCTRAGDWQIVWPDANPPGALPISRHEQRLAMRGAGWPDAILRPSFPLPNVWLGVSAEDQRRADERIPDLLATPAAIRFVSAEPLLGPIDFTRWLTRAREIREHFERLRSLDDEVRQESIQDRNGVALPRNLPNADRLCTAGAEATAAPSHEAAEGGLEPAHHLGRGAVDRQSGAVRATGSAPPVEVPLSVEQSCGVSQGGNIGRDHHGLIVDGRTDAAGEALTGNLTLNSSAARAETFGEAGDGLSSDIATADGLAPFRGSDHMRPQSEDDLSTSRIDWVIAGGESGPNARPMHPDWARSIRDQCAAAGTAFFFKQWGEWSPHTAALEDGEGGIRTSPGGGVNWQAEKPGGAFGVFRVGKARAGRLLDGVTHDAIPDARHG